MSDDGRIDLPAPTVADLEEAAMIVLGEAGEAPLGDDGAKIFKGLEQIFLQGRGEACGEWIGTAPRELQDRVLAAAAEIRKAKAKAEAEEAADPAKNPMIKIDP